MMERINHLLLAQSFIPNLFIFNFLFKKCELQVYERLKQEGM